VDDCNAALIDHVQERFSRALRRWEVFFSRYLTELGETLFVRESGGFPLTVVAIDQAGFKSAYQTEVRCPKGHSHPVAVVSARLCLFIYRTGFLLASLWRQQSPTHLVREEPPTAVHLNEFGESVRDYFSVSPLHEANLAELVKARTTSHAYARKLFLDSVSAAEQFVLFHELSHVDPSLRKIRINADPDTFWQSERGLAWRVEIACDAEASKLVLLAAASYNIKLGTPKKDARTFAGLVMGVGTDLALGAIELLERVEHGDVQEAVARVHPAFAQHPPATLRRNWLSWYTRDLIEKASNISPSDAENMVQSVGSIIRVRTYLFEQFLLKRGDIVAEVRNT
jgi:hypothetical protein